MKQLKFLMVAFTLLMGVSFTSCLNDDAGESMYDGIGYVFAVRNKAYDVKQIMSDFKGKHGSYPTTIRIKAKTDMDGAKLPEKYTDYTIENFKWNPSNQ